MAAKYLQQSLVPPQLVSSLYEGIQSVQLIAMLAHNCTNHISDGHHADHSSSSDHRNVPDPIICQPRVWSNFSPDCCRNRKYQKLVPVINCIALRTFVSGVTVISLFCNQSVHLGFIMTIHMNPNRIYVCIYAYLFSHDIPNFGWLGWPSLDNDFPQII